MKSLVLVLFFILNPLCSYSLNVCDVYSCITEYIRDSVKSSLVFEKIWIYPQIIQTYDSLDYKFNCNYDDLYFSICEDKENCNYPLLYLSQYTYKEEYIYVNAYLYWIPQVRLELFFKLKKKHSDIYILECKRNLKL